MSIKQTSSGVVADSVEPVELYFSTVYCCIHFNQSMGFGNAESDMEAAPLTVTCAQLSSGPDVDGMAHFITRYHRLKRSDHPVINIRDDRIRDWQKAAARGT
jgi:hypothetical protein